jgi:WD40 repeat protein
VLSGSADGTAQLWEVVGDALKEGRTLPGHNRGVNGVAFAPDGKALATVGDDGRILLWADPAGGRPARVKEWQVSGPVRSVAFAPDGRHLAVGNGNGTVYILRLPPREK